MDAGGIIMESVLPYPSPPNELTSLQPSQALRLAATFTVLAAVLPLMLHLFNDYRLFVTLGPGGTPTTIRGYLRVKTLSLFALADPSQPAPVPRHLKSSHGYLLADDFPLRRLPRPETRGIAPHRQITQKAGEGLFGLLSSRINAMGSDSDKMVCRTSCFEKHASGLFSLSPAKRTCAGEICHAHPSDGSMHLTLHPVDAGVVLRAGWGERHPLARGGWFERFVPGGFVMIYAPRDENEVETVMKIVRAAAWFVGGGDASRELDEEKRRDSGYMSGESPQETCDSEVSNI